MRRPLAHPPLLLTAALTLLLGLVAHAAGAQESTDAASATRPALAEVPNLDPASDLPIDLVFAEPVSVREIYRAIGNAFGLEVYFAPKFRDTNAAVEMRDATCNEALDRLAEISGTFWVATGDRSILVADDTPQQRREYEPILIRSYRLEHARLADMMTLVRALAGVKHVAADETSNMLTVRDSARVVSVIDQIVDVHDRRPAELEVDIEILQVDAKGLDALRGQGSVAPKRLVHLARASAGLIGSRNASLGLYGVNGTGNEAIQELEVELAAEVDGEDVTLDVALSVVLAGTENEDGEEGAPSRLGSRTSWRSEAGAPVLVELPSAGDGGQILVARLTPTILHPGDFADAKVWVGTEAQAGTKLAD